MSSTCSTGGEGQTRGEGKALNGSKWDEKREYVCMLISVFQLIQHQIYMQSELALLLDVILFSGPIGSQLMDSLIMLNHLLCNMNTSLLCCVATVFMLLSAMLTGSHAIKKDKRKYS